MTRLRLWRRVDVPLSSTLLALHDIIQIAVGWIDSHMFEFVIGEHVLRRVSMRDEDSWTGTCTRPPHPA